MKSYGLYIHIPFCLKKCNYCDFVSLPYRQELADKYLSALFLEMRLLSNKYNFPVVETVYLGGGTPTCLSGDRLKEILERIRDNFLVAKEVEITCEVNPATGFKKDLDIMIEAGINRLSLGAQSFDNDILSFLGRIHSKEEIVETYYAARKAGFKNINFDLIFAVPSQTENSWLDSLKEAIKLNPQHLSLYSLKIEKGTPFYEEYKRKILTPVDEELEYLMYHDAISLVSQKGYEHYEISNFAKKGYKARHNLIYWRLKPYLALGPGGHGFDGSIRYQNTANLKKYVDSLNHNLLPYDEIITLTKKDLMEEFVIMGLRLIEGISMNEFKERFGQSITQIYGNQIEKLVNLGLLQVSKDRLALTDQGVYLGNDVFAEFLL